MIDVQDDHAALVRVEAELAPQERVLEVLRRDAERRDLRPLAGLDAIEEIPIEDYLRGVLPAEMSVSWPIEALKAQAVAARSDVVAALSGRYTLEGYDFFATERSRAYQGAASFTGRETGR